jgi:hypothetical protein
MLHEQPGLRRDLEAVGVRFRRSVRQADLETVITLLPLERVVNP